MGVLLVSRERLADPGNVKTAANEFSLNLSQF